MARIAVVLITGPFVNGKKNGETVTVPAGGAAERAWAAYGDQVRITYREVGGPPAPVPLSGRAELVAVKAATALEGYARDATALPEEALPFLRAKLRTHPGALSALQVLLGLSVGLSAEDPTVASEATAADATAFDAFLLDLREVLGEAAEHEDAEALLDRVETLMLKLGELSAERAPGSTDPAAGASVAAIMLAELLGNPDGFTVLGVRDIATRNGIELPSSGGKAELLNMIELAVNGAEAVAQKKAEGAAPTPTEVAAPKAATEASAPSGADSAPNLLDELDRDPADQA